MTALLLAWAIAPASTRAAYADSITLGVVSFDVFIPGDEGAPGVDVIDIFNLTGDPLAGGFALDPDFPSNTPVALLGASLVLVVDGVEQVTFLGDIAPGVLDPPFSLFFPDTVSISSLTLSATLSATELLRGDGTTFLAASPALTLTMLPASGDAFVHGFDMALITVESAPAPAPVPEPGTFALFAAGVTGMGMRGWAARRRRGQPPHRTEAD